MLNVKTPGCDGRSRRRARRDPKLGAKFELAKVRVALANADEPCASDLLPAFPLQYTPRGLVRSRGPHQRGVRRERAPAAAHRGANARCLCRKAFCASEKALDVANEYGPRRPPSRVAQGGLTFAKLHEEAISLLTEGLGRHLRLAADADAAAAIAARCSGPILRRWPT